MLIEAKHRTEILQAEMQTRGISHAVFTSESSIAYLAGFWGYLGIEFGRPSMLVVRSDGAPSVITPLMESEMVAEMTWVEDIHRWEDAGQNSWGRARATCLPKKPEQIWVEQMDIPAIVRHFIDETYRGVALCDIGPILGAQRMIKSPLEIEVIKQAGFLTDQGWERFVSPMIHNLQILQSGRDTSMVHRRASVKAYEKADPVYFCFCNMAQFKQYKLGFDRMFHVADVTEDAARVQQAAIDAQQAAIAAIKPGVTAESIAAAADVIYAERGYATGYRTGRSIGVAYLEAPELKAGDTTILQAGMTFAVDGGISVDGVMAGRIGDSIVVTENGAEYLTQYPRELLVTDS
jgi:Xaa-Pro dipeptidase